MWRLTQHHPEPAQPSAARTTRSAQLPTRRRSSAASAVRASMSVLPRRHTRGGDSGPSLLRSGVVLDDQHGERIAPVVRRFEPACRSSRSRTTRSPTSPTSSTRSGPPATDAVPTQATEHHRRRTRKMGEVFFTRMRVVSVASRRLARPSRRRLPTRWLLQQTWLMPRQWRRPRQRPPVTINPRP